MALKIPVLGTIRWYIPGDEDIESYEIALGHEYTAPQIREGGDPAYLELQQLSDAAFAHAQSIQAASEESLSPELVEHVIRHGVIGWHGLYRGSDPLSAPQFEEGPFGKRLAIASYRALLPFLASHIAMLAAHLFMLSLPRKSS